MQDSDNTYYTPSIHIVNKVSGLHVWHKMCLINVFKMTGTYGIAPIEQVAFIKPVFS